MGGKARKTLVIKESEWGQNALKNPSGTKCCLGFYCEQFHPEVPPGALGGAHFPKGVGVQFPRASVAGLPHEELSDDIRELDYYLAAINDSDLPDSERKRAIRAGFRRIGINVRFVP